MESSNHPIPTMPPEQQLPPVPEGVEYSKEHAEAIAKGHLKLHKLGEASLLFAAGVFNLTHMAGGNIPNHTDYAEAVPTDTGTAIIQPVHEDYMSGDILSNTRINTANQTHITAERQTDQKDDKNNKGGMDLSELYNTDVARFSEVVRDLEDDDTPPKLPDDFPTKKLPINITLETPKDALKKQLLNH